MLTISDGEALSRVPEPSLHELIQLRIRQLSRDYDGPLEDIVVFHVVEPGDGQEEIAQAIGFSPLQNLVDGTTFGDPDFSPGWEWIEAHCCAYELCFVLEDSGFGHVVLVPKDPGIDSELVGLCAQYGSEHA